MTGAASQVGRMKQLLAGLEDDMAEAEDKLAVYKDKALEAANQAKAKALEAKEIAVKKGKEAYELAQKKAKELSKVAQEKGCCIIQ